MTMQHRANYSFRTGRDTKREKQPSALWIHPTDQLHQFSALTSSYVSKSWFVPPWSHLPPSCVFPADIHAQEKAAAGPSGPFLKGRSPFTRWVPDASTEVSAAHLCQLTFTTACLSGWVASSPPSTPGGCSGGPPGMPCTLGSCAPNQWSPCWRELGPPRHMAPS